MISFESDICLLMDGQNLLKHKHSNGGREMSSVFHFHHKWAS